MVKVIIACVLSVFLMVSLFETAYASHKTVCSCKKVKHHHKYKKTHYVQSGYYEPGYCVTKTCGCCSKQVCYEPRYVHCHTDFYYHHGRNTSRVEICN